MSSVTAIRNRDADEETRRKKRVQSAWSSLACPRCGGNLELKREERGAFALCLDCSTSYPFRQGRLYFSEPVAAAEDLDALKSILKRSLGGWYYAVGVTLLSPDYPFRLSRHLRRFADPSRELVVDLGSGNRRFDPDILNVDCTEYPEVDIVCDITKLPFKSGKVDAFITASVLEHVPDPQAVADECRRCTRPGGIGLHTAPFIYPFHASPDDYHRFSHEGIRLLFKGWEVAEQRNITGPASLLVAIHADIFSRVLSFGSAKAQSVLYLIASACLCPFKFLDVFFVNRRRFLGIAPTILTVVRRQLTCSIG